ncbi:LPXTG cell wall anchor domain-containing protein [Listeria sp. FSL L7-0083]|uniref:InlB B-repeat-containing protein n=1 Tax=Listeria farberi TaxID=2713500 RepID=UPI001625641C|nr:InlB B-repeat-containing protein [Listeria farberi]MBC2266335.1 LPXTG cell wall anchor domain-containing protein [Listeria farberi]
MKSNRKLFLYIVLVLSIVIGTNIFIKIDARAAAAPPAAITQIFPDDSLAKEIQTTLGKSSTMDVVTQAELDTINTLHIESSGISSLEGMNYVSQLTYLSFSSNQVSDLAPIGNLINLEYLDLSTNQVTNISPLAGLTNLNILQLGGNSISDLRPLSNLNNLEFLDIKDAKVSDITPLVNLTNLTGLVLYNNNVSDLEPIKNLRGLRSLNIGKNTLTSLNGLENLTSLGVLYAQENQITDLQPLSSLENLSAAILTSNQVESIEPLAGLTKIHSLYLSNNQITDVTGLSSLINMDWLEISQNKISNIRPLNSLTNLTTIQMTDQLIVNKPIIFQNTLTIPNLVKNIAEQTIAPNTISDSGIYTNGNVTWNLTGYIPQVSYTFAERDTVGNATGIFSGTVEQPLLQYYKATFNIDGQETTENVETGTLLEEPPTPIKEGYTFNGWYDAKTGGTKWDFTVNTMPANDLTLYAQFSINSYTATFDVDGVISTQTVEYQGLLEEPPAPTKEGYTFKGWYDAKSGGAKWDFANNQMPANNLTLYAQFSKEATSGGDSGGTDKGGGNIEIKANETRESNAKNQALLPATGDKQVLFPIIIGTFLTSFAILALRRK